MRAYRALPLQEHDHAVWETFQQRLATTEPLIATILELSRKNFDPQARVLMTMLDGQFDTIDRSINTLLRAKNAEADRAVAQI